MRSIYAAIVLAILTMAWPLVCSSQSSGSNPWVSCDGATGQSLITLIDLFGLDPTPSATDHQDSAQKVAGLPGYYIDPLRFPEVPEVNLTTRKISAQEKRNLSGSSDLAMALATSWSKGANPGENQTQAQTNQDIPQDGLEVQVLADGPGQLPYS